MNRPLKTVGWLAGIVVLGAAAVLSADALGIDTGALYAVAYKKAETSISGNMEPYGTRERFEQALADFLKEKTPQGKSIFLEELRQLARNSPADQIPADVRTVILANDKI